MVKPKEIKDRFLEDNLEFMMTEFKEVLHGEKGDFVSKSAYAIKTAYPLLFKMIENASDIDVTLAKTSSGIVQMIAQGDITAAEAIELLQLLDKASRVRDRELTIELKERMVDTINEDAAIEVGGDK